MKSLFVAAFVCAASAIILASCGGGGGGGAPANVVAKVYLFGAMSSNSTITSVFSNISTANFKDYSAPTSTATGTFPLRSGVLTASGPIKVSIVDGTYNTANKRLSIQLVNGAGFTNLSSSTTKNSGKGTEMATLVMKPGTALNATDKSPDVGRQQISPLKIGHLNGCKVNYAP